MSQHLERLLRGIGEEAFNTLAEGMKPTDLQSLMLEVYRRRAESVSAPKVLERYRSSRFVRPSPADPRKLLELDRLAFEIAEGFEPLELSPLCPLGTVSALGTVSQNNVVSTSRNAEVVADATNCLALECADRRSRGQAEAHLCSSHRVTRAQFFDQPNSWAHFRLFGLCSAGKDRGGYDFQLESLARHIDFYLRLLSSLRNASYRIGAIQVKLTDFGGSRAELMQTHVVDPLAGTHPDAVFDFYPERETGRGYYDEVCFQIHVADPTGEFQFLVDGGFTDWTRKLLGSKKESLLISGIGSERLCAVFAA